VLQQRFLPEPVPDDALLLARIHAARGEHEQARSMLAWVAAVVRADAIAPSHRLIESMIELATRADDAGAGLKAWQRFLADAEPALTGELLLEAFYLEARAAARDGQSEALARILARGETVLRDYPIWMSSFADLGVQMTP
jgi:hypothetical protein